MVIIVAVVEDERGLSLVVDTVVAVVVVGVAIVVVGDVEEAVDVVDEVVGEGDVILILSAVRQVS